MTFNKQFRYPPTFPNEAFVQAMLEQHFAPPTFLRETRGYVDLVVQHTETTERWVIEAKGKTSDPGLDFRTCLGQILTVAQDDGARYAVALPLILPYLRLCAAISNHVRWSLNLSWIFVAPDGMLQIIGPDESLPTLDEGEAQ